MAERSTDSEPGGRRVPRRRGWRPIYWLLVIPFLGTLIPPIYNARVPEAFGIPFFYWYQMVWIPIGVLCTVIVYRATRGKG